MRRSTARPVRALAAAYRRRSASPGGYAHRRIAALPRDTGWRVDDGRVERPWGSERPRVFARIGAKPKRFTTFDRFPSVSTLFFQGLVDTRNPFARFRISTRPTPLSERTGRRRSDGFTALEGGLRDRSRPDDLRELRQRRRSGGRLGRLERRRTTLGYRRGLRIRPLQPLQRRSQDRAARRSALQSDPAEGRTVSCPLGDLGDSQRKTVGNPILTATGSSARPPARDERRPAIRLKRETTPPRFSTSSALLSGTVSRRQVRGSLGAPSRVAIDVSARSPERENARSGEPRPKPVPARSTAIGGDGVHGPSPRSSASFLSMASEYRTCLANESPTVRAQTRRSRPGAGVLNPEG